MRGTNGGHVGGSDGRDLDGQTRRGQPAGEVVRSAERLVAGEVALAAGEEELEAEGAGIEAEAAAGGSGEEDG
jgi:hypothetical protein